MLVEYDILNVTTFFRVGRFTPNSKESVKCAMLCCVVQVCARKNARVFRVDVRCGFIVAPQNTVGGRFEGVLNGASGSCASLKGPAS